MWRLTDDDTEPVITARDCACGSGGMFVQPRF